MSGFACKRAQSPHEVSAFELHFGERLADGAIERRVLRVSEPTRDREKGLWVCQLDLPGVLRRPATAYGMPPIDGGDSTPHQAQVAALEIARTVLQTRTLVTDEGAGFEIPRVPPVCGSGA